MRLHPAIPDIDKTPENGRLIEKIIKKGDQLKIGVMASYDMLDIRYSSYKEVYGFTVCSAREEISALIFKEVKKKVRKSVSTKVPVRSKIVKNLEIDFGDPELLPAFRKRVARIPAGFAKKRNYPFVKILKSGGSAAEPINALELALIFASETKKYPGTEKCFKLYYAERLLSLGTGLKIKKKRKFLELVTLSSYAEFRVYNLFLKTKVIGIIQILIQYPCITEVDC